MKQYDAIIFDVDGTLWDARDSVAVGWNEALIPFTGELGHLTGEELGRHFGIPTEEIIRKVLPDLPEEQVKPYADLCYAKTNEKCYEKPGRYYDGVIDTLYQLKKKYPLYIVSNCQLGYIECAVAGAHLEEVFSGWMCWQETGLPKDGTIRLLMERYGLKNPVYVGDTQGDVDASRKAGIDVISVTYGLGTPTDTDREIGHFGELLEIL